MQSQSPEGFLLRPTDIPLIITSNHSSPEVVRRSSDNHHEAEYSPKNGMNSKTNEEQKQSSPLQSSLQGSSLQGSSLQGPSFQGTPLQTSSLQATPLQSSKHQRPTSLQASPHQTPHPLNLLPSGLQSSGLQASSLQASALQAFVAQASNFQASQENSDQTSTLERKGRNIGGSLKYDIGRNNSVSNLIPLPAKWSSVRIKGTGFNDSRKSVVKIEPCNGAPNINKKEYEILTSPNSSNSHKKANIGNVSLLMLKKLLMFKLFMLKLFIKLFMFKLLMLKKLFMSFR